MVNIEVKIFATLQKYIKSKDKIIKMEVKKGTKVEDVIQELGLPKELVKIAIINNQKVPLTEEVSSGDKLSLFPLIAGG